MLLTGSRLWIASVSVKKLGRESINVFVKNINFKVNHSQYLIVYLIVVWL